MRPWGRLNGNAGRDATQIVREVAHHDDSAQFNAFLVKNKEEASNMVIRCTSHVCDRMANVLFDPDYTYSYTYV